MSKENNLRYSDAELEEFKALILEKLEKANNELSYMRQQIVDINSNGSDQQGGDYMDDSSLHTEVEMLNQMVSRQQQFIRNLENALIRVKNKKYGVCTITGKLIDKKRLLLVPHATKSIAGKQGTSNVSLKSRPKPITRKEKPSKIISKVVRKASESTTKSSDTSTLIGDQWEDSEEINDIPTYENPIMELDLEKLGVDTSEEE